MPIYDFECTCGKAFEAFSEPITENGKHAGVQAQECPRCGELAAQVWRRAPGFMGEENVPRERLAAARNGVIVHGRGYVEPFSGSTRSELRAWEKKNNLVPIERAERLSRKVEVNQRVKWTDSEEFRRLNEANIHEAAQIARAGDDAVRKALDEYERPNQFDTNAFAAQVSGGVIQADGAANEFIRAAAEELPSKTA